MSKKYICIASVFILAITLLSFIFIPTYIEKRKIKNAIVEVDLKDDLRVPFNTHSKVSDYIESINGTIKDDFTIDTTTLGQKTIEFEFTNDDGITVPYSFSLNVVDITPPIVWVSGKYTITTDFKGNLRDKIMCVDDADDNPECEIIGEYNTTEVGSYNLIYKATDASGNIKEEQFILDVKAPSKSNSISNRKTYFSDAKNLYKSEDTALGVDVSSWQGDIDFEKLKQSGVEFAIVRVGSKKGTNKEYFLDSKFERNVKGFNAVGIPVGLYFYSYAGSKEEAIKDAEWILEQIKGYNIELPIAYDWENWSSYNQYHLSIYHLTENAIAFLDVIKNAGYEGMLYSSKNYLESIWLPTPYRTWLAHYTEKTSYSKEFSFWQFCNNGRIDGIDGDVDLDIMYRESE